eukprot:352377-Rhodomonas_salina.3
MMRLRKVAHLSGCDSSAARTTEAVHARPQHSVCQILKAYVALIFVILLLRCRRFWRTLCLTFYTLFLTPLHSWGPIDHNKLTTCRRDEAVDLEASRTQVGGRDSALARLFCRTRWDCGKGSVLNSRETSWS